MCRLSRNLASGLILASTLLLGSGTEAAEKIVVGVTGTPNAQARPFYIAIEKGFLAAEDITVNKIFAPSSVSARKRMCKAFASNRVDARIWRRRNCLVTLVFQLLDDFGPD